MTLEPETKRRIVVGLVGVALLVVAFSAGRFSAPARVELREVEKLVEKIDYRSLATEDITRGFTFAKAETKTVYRNITTTIVVTPDAGTTTTIADNSVEHVGSTENATGTEQEKKTKTVYVDVEVVKEVVKEKIVTLQPTWGAGLDVGASLQEPFVPIAGPLVLGLRFEWRIVGGIWVGAWVSTSGAAGGSVKYTH